MSLTPPQINEFLPRMLATDQQLHNRVEQYGKAVAGDKAKVGDEESGKTASYLSFVEDFRKLKLLAAFVNGKVDGMQKYVKECLVPNINEAYDLAETEWGLERLSNPKTNYVQNGGFRLWNAAVNLPLGWTATNAPTITRVAGRTLPPTGTQGGNYGVKIASGGSAGSISRTFRVKPGSLYRVCGWVNVEASGSFTVTVLDNGTGAVAQPFTRTAAQIGAAAWFSFPRVNFDALAFQTTSDATSVTITLESTTINKYAIFSDIQCVQGPQADADMWEPAPEDIESAPALPGAAGTVVIKAALQNVISSTTLVDVTSLVKAIAANENWQFEFNITCVASLTTTGIKVAVTVPASATLAMRAVMVDNGGGAMAGGATASGTAVDFQTGMFVGNGAVIRIEGTVQNSTTAGNIQLQFAQSTSVATNVTISAGADGVFSLQGTS